MVHLGNDWDELLKEEFQKEYYQRLRKILIREYRTKPSIPTCTKSMKPSS